MSILTYNMNVCINNNNGINYTESRPAYTPTLVYENDYYTTSNPYWFPLVILAEKSSDRRFFYFDFNSGTFKRAGDQNVIDVNNDKITGIFKFTTNSQSFNPQEWLWSGKCWIQVAPLITGAPEVLTPNANSVFKMGSTTLLTLFQPSCGVLSGIGSYMPSYCGYITFISSHENIEETTNFTTGTTKSSDLQWQSQDDVEDARQLVYVCPSTLVWNTYPTQVLSSGSSLLTNGATNLRVLTNTVASPFPTMIPAPILKHRGFMVPLYAIGDDGVTYASWDATGYHVSNTIMWDDTVAGDNTLTVSSKPNLKWARLYCVYTNSYTDWL